ncbi:hypothetical protein GQ53DRAFT_830953 [Thozetella sp. PMI_491]|nr:hypothetical protein GQ53DRAFT_830953 [Thozetella sp. PMI_491]
MCCYSQCIYGSHHRYLIDRWSYFNDNIDNPPVFASTETDTITAPASLVTITNTVPGSVTTVIDSETVTSVSTYIPDAYTSYIFKRDEMPVDRRANSQAICSGRRVLGGLEVFACNIISSACSELLPESTTTMSVTVSGSTVTTTTMSPVMCGTTTLPPITSTHTTSITGPASVTTVSTQLPASVSVVTSSLPPSTQTISTQLPAVTVSETTTPTSTTTMFITAAGSTATQTIATTVQATATETACPYQDVASVDACSIWFGQRDNNLYELDMWGTCGFNTASPYTIIPGTIDDPCSAVYACYNIMEGTDVVIMFSAKESAWKCSTYDSVPNFVEDWDIVQYYRFAH